MGNVSVFHGGTALLPRPAGGTMWSGWWTVEHSSVLSVRGGSLPSADEWSVTGALEMGAAGTIVVGREVHWSQQS